LNLLITLTGNSLTIKEVEKVLYGYEEICLDETSLKKVDASRQVVEKIVAEEQGQQRDVLFVGYFF